MSLELTARADALSKKTNIENQIILEIDGIDLIFGAITVSKIVKYGEDNIVYGLADLVYGGVIPDSKGRDYISLEGSSTRIKQQIDPDKAATTSVQKITIEMIDKNQELSNLFSPGKQVDDVLAKKAKVWINFKGGAHPEDSSLIMSGLIDSIDFPPAAAKLVISHPETLKRTELFQLVATTLDGAITDSDSIIALNSTTNLFEPVDVLKTYMQIDDEIIQYTGVSGNNITGCTRGHFNTIATAHDDDSDAESRHRLEDQPISLALKLMLSGLTEKYGDTNISEFVSINGDPAVDDTAFIADVNFQKNLGLVVGDLIAITGASNGANNVTDVAISAFQKVGNGTIITVEGAGFVIEAMSSAVAVFKSKYNTLPDGCRMTTEMVDVERHEFWNTLLANSFPDLDFFLKDTVNAKDFINKSVYFPCGIYPVPRTGRSSMNVTIPPLALENAPVIDSKNLINPNKVTLKRSMNKNFYNAITWKYEEDQVESKFKRGEITQSSQSTGRIKTFNKPLVISAEGFRDTPEVTNFIKKQTQRFLQRYQYGSEHLDCETDYETGLKTEVGDVVIFGDSELKITDTSKGNRFTQEKLYEVTNKQIDLKTGKTKLSLINSGFGLDSRVGVISPSSLVNNGATTTRLPLKRSYSTVFGINDENSKWQDYIGQPVEAHSADFSQRSESVLIGFDPSNAEVMIVDPALSFIPGEDDIVNMINYPASSDPGFASKWKTIHVFMGITVDVVSGASDTVFDVNVGDVVNFFVGSYVRVHTPDFSTDSSSDISSPDAVITDITGTTLTVDRSLGFTPNSSHKVTVIGFSADEGLPYRWL